MVDPVHVKCPESLRPFVAEVLEGEYDVPGFEFARPPHILDIGANVGAFALWARHRWPGATVECYEPNPQALPYLHANLDPFVIHEVAVRAKAGREKLHFGLTNIGEAGFFTDPNERGEDGVEVECIAAEHLPACDILKIDTEGCEMEILCNDNGVRSTTRLVLLEFHSPRHREQIDRLLCALDFTLVRGLIRNKDRGTLCYARLP